MVFPAVEEAEFEEPGDGPGDGDGLEEDARQRQSNQQRQKEGVVEFADYISDDWTIYH